VWPLGDGLGTVQGAAPPGLCQKVKVSEPFNTDLARGDAAYNVFAGVLEAYRKTGGPHIDLRERMVCDLSRRR
jgi:hypothetical protein